MGRRTVSVKERVYRKLKEEKRPGETFSDVVDRLLRTKPPPLVKHVGAWRPMSPRELEDIRDRIDQLRHRTPER